MLAPSERTLTNLNATARSGSPAHPHHRVCSRARERPEGTLHAAEEVRACLRRQPVLTRWGASVRNGRSSSRFGPTTPQLDSGTSFQTPAMSVRGSETISRASSGDFFVQLAVGVELAERGDVGGVVEHA